MHICTRYNIVCNTLLVSNFSSLQRFTITLVWPWIVNIMIRLFSSRARYRSVQKHACFEAAWVLDFKSAPQPPAQVGWETATCRAGSLSINAPRPLQFTAPQNSEISKMIRLFSSRARYRSVQKHACFEAAWVLDFKSAPQPKLNFKQAYSAPNWCLANGPEKISREQPLVYSN